MAETFPTAQHLLEYLFEKGWKYEHLAGRGAGFKLNTGPVLPDHDAYALQKAIETAPSVATSPHYAHYIKGQSVWAVELGWVSSETTLPV